MVGRKPKPASLKALEGSRNRRKNVEPEPGGIATPPKHLSAIAKKEWRRLGPELQALGLLTSSDQSAFAAYCQTYARWAEAEQQIAKFGLVIKSPKSGFPVPNPYVGIANVALDKMRSFAGEFGLTPASRSRLSVSNAPATSASAFEEFMGSIGAADITTDDFSTQLR